MRRISLPLSGRRCHLLGFALAALIRIVLPSESPAQDSTFDLNVLGQLTNLSDPRISPDGTSLVLVASQPNYEKNRFERQLILVELLEGGHRALTHTRPKVRHPRWSPDGKRVAFMAADEDGKMQIQELSMLGGEARPITTSPTGVITFAWRPDGQAIAYVATDESAEKEGEERHNKSFIVGDNDYLTKEAPLPSHIWLVGTEPGSTAERLTSGERGVSTYVGTSIAWSPDGSTLAYTSQAEPHSGHMNRMSIWLLDLESGGARVFVPRQSYYEGVAFSPDGGHLAYSTADGPGDFWHPHHVFKRTLSDGTEAGITLDVDRAFWDFRWARDRDVVVAMANDLTRRSMWVFDSDGANHQLNLGSVDATEVATGPNGSIAFLGIEPNRPEELYYLESPDDSPVRLTGFNDGVATLPMGRVEQVAWAGPDGFQEYGVLVYPTEYVEGRRYPLVLHIHGGPMSTSIEGFHVLRQLMAAEGWLVFSPNYRGSDNMGRGYQTAVIDDAGDGPGRDVMAGIDAVKSMGIVDEDKIAVSGWSYGGYMTTWLIGHYGGWASAVAGAAVTDYADGYNLSDINVGFASGFRGSPWVGDHAKDWVEQSPITSWRRMEAPTLVLSNTGDVRVPITQSYKLYRALKDNGVEVQFVAYPIGGHFPADPVHQRDLYDRWVGWIRDHFEVGREGSDP